MRAFCIHGHFYQPPREDPLTGEIPIEAGAAPYRNWNERIHAECYRPNAELGNFERISFNVGPTLFTWMAGYDPQTYQRILDQDRANVERYGVGNAMAQAYNHTILPLATRDDKITQVRWGIADFIYRFQRIPRGMWLPETAVDLETLEVLADHGIEFTILAPWQANVKEVDTSQPYRVDLPNGKSLAVFFYHRDLSTQVSFDPGATVNADQFLENAVIPNYRVESLRRTERQLIMVASDGELYGHHQPFRDKFLAYLMDGALKGSDVRLTFPGLWLSRNQVKRSISIRENTSWSCLHGVMRWKGECGCTPKGKWKAPLRRAFTNLASKIDQIYVFLASMMVSDPLELRNQYIEVMLGKRTLEDLAHSHETRELNEADLWRLNILLSAQYQRQRMFTSCGWFFDDFDRIEPRNNVAYAAQAVWLTFMASGVDLSDEAMSYLHLVKSSRSGLRADQIFAHYLSRSQSNLSVS